MTTATTIKVRLQVRQDTAANWTGINPVLLAGELGRETDTGKIKIGNGSTAWSGLSYQPFGGQITNADISATAEIAVSKLADGAARQLLQTAANGTDVEWTSNVDVPGTLDVTGAATFDSSVTITGDLTVNGTTTNINTQNLVVEDKNVILGDVATPTDVTADGGGITLKGATDKTITWSDTTDSWEFNQPTITTGTATAAALIPSGSSVPTNGVYLPSANNVAISTNSTQRVVVDSSGNLTLNAQGDLRFADADSSNWVAFQGPATVSSNVTWTLPSADGTANQVLSTNGSGTLSWATPAAGGASVTTSDTAPSTPADGDLWYDSVGGRLYVYYQDPNGSQWVDAAPQGGGSSTPTKIEVGNTKAEVTDTGSNGTFAVTTEGTQRLTVDSSGRTLIGATTSRNDFFNNTTTVAGGIQLELSASDNLNRFMSFVSNNSDTGGPSFLFGKSRGTSANSKTIVQSDDQLAALNFHGADGSDMVEAARISAHVDGTPGANDMPGRIVLATTPDGSASPVERMRVTSGGAVCINDTTSYIGGLLNIRGGSATTVGISIKSIADNNYGMSFHNTAGTTVGNVTIGASSTSFVTSSDYRLKENIVPLTGAADRLNQLQVHRFNFIGDPDTTVDGFIAHEAQAVVPECVTGEKDAVNEDGSIKPQGIDQSKLVPLITAALQEAIQKIETQGAAIAALEAANTDLAARITALEAN